MLKKQEIINIVLAIIVFTFIVIFGKIIENNLSFEFLMKAILFSSFIIISSIVAKKITANYFESTLEIKTWKMERFGFRREQVMEKKLSTGIILPIFISIISLGKVFLLTLLESDLSGTSARASKRHGIYRFTELTEIHMCLIVSAGVVTSLIISIFAYLINLPELGRWSIYYATASIIPFSNLDGTKIFFGSKTIWFGLTIVTLIFLSYALFLP